MRARRQADRAVVNGAQGRRPAGFHPIALLRLFFGHEPLTTRQAASRLAQQSQTVRRARKSAKIAEHVKRLRADIDAQAIANGAQPKEWKHG